jgi:hypothetical protein
VNVGETFPFEAFWALAVNIMVVPSCMEALTDGFNVIFAGKGLEPGGLCPPQAGSSRNRMLETMIPVDGTQPNLRMQPHCRQRNLRQRAFAPRTNLK